jgi:hypothetical protein
LDGGRLVDLLQDNHVRPGSRQHCQNVGLAAEAAMHDHITSVIEALNSLAEEQAGAGRSAR